MPLGFLSDWRLERARRTHASAYVTALLLEPSVADVQWLAATAAHGDEDHARWELRYARRASGVLIAQRDALDDRTASLVSSALTRAWARDPQVASDRREIAARQFNARLAAYADALSEKSPREGTSARLARVLLGFAGRLDPTPAELAAAGERLATYLRESSEALREAFGAAILPDDEPPSAARK
jgi:hypothetical protein